MAYIVFGMYYMFKRYRKVDFFTTYCSNNSLKWIASLVSKMSIEPSDMSDGDSIKFLEGHEVRTALILLPSYAKKSVYIMVPYIGRGQLLTSILNIPNNITVKMFTRDKKGYLPSIKTLADPTLNELKLKKNIQVFIDNKIHAKIWLIEEMAIVHSMNGTFHSENHNFQDTSKLIREQGVTSKGIILGNNIWVGAKVTFLDGSKIGNNSVVAAGAVVNGEFPANVVIGGVPAKILKHIE